MTLQQLRYLCRMVDCGFNVSQAARTLHTSQPGVSRYLHLLESELGVQLFVRNRKRIKDLTPAGQAIVAVGKRMVSDADNLENIAKDYRAGDAGDLTIATFHTHARYTLPPVIERFTKRHLFESSSVHVGLRRNAYLSDHMIHFIELFAPSLRRAQIESAVRERAPGVPRAAL